MKPLLHHPATTDGQPAIPFVSLQYPEPQTHCLTLAAQRVIQSGIYLRGNETKSFEQEWAAFTAQQYCVGVANGLDALTLVLLAWKTIYHWDDGDQVIVSAHTFYASHLAILRARLIPVPCDATADGYLLNPQLIPHLITPRTRAILPVHLYGFTADMPTIMQIANDHSLLVLCDAAQCHTQPQSPLTYGHAAAFSFYPTKNLAALGDAGAITTNDPELANTVRLLANYGGNYTGNYPLIGINSRLDELQAALLRTKMAWLQQETARRRQIAQRYITQITNPHIMLPPIASVNSSTWHIFPLLTPHRDALQAHLAQKGIQTAIHYPIPPHQQPTLRQIEPQNLNQTLKIAQEQLSIPIFAQLKDTQVDYIINQINNFTPN